MKDTKYHPDWQKNRIKFIIDIFGKEFFKGKKILELGPFNGYIGNYFTDLGSEVYMVEGRVENVDNIKKDYPKIKSVIVSDLDTDKWEWGKFDIIINFGLVYHLEKYHVEHIENCINNCDFLFLESVIFDSNDSELHFRDEVGADQSLSNKSGTPSTSYIENIFNNFDVKYTKYSDPKLNGNGHTYNWNDNNTKKYYYKNRILWIVEK